MKKKETITEMIRRVIKEELPFTNDGRKSSELSSLVKKISNE